MADVYAPLVVLAALVGVYAVMFRGVGGRVGRPPKGFLTRLEAPDSVTWVGALLSGLALGTAASLVDPAADGNSGLMIGLFVAILFAVRSAARFVEPAFALVAVLIALASLARFIAGEGVDLAIAYRTSLALLIFASFCLAALIFGRLAAFNKARGWALFGLVEVVTFLAEPGSRAALDLDAVGHLQFLAVACATAFALGWLASEYLLGVVGVAIATVQFLENAVVGDADASWVGLVGGVSALGFLMGLRIVTSPFRR